jgi:hypothetical protein
MQSREDLNDAIIVGLCVNLIRHYLSFKDSRTNAIGLIEGLKKRGLSTLTQSPIAFDIATLSSFPRTPSKSTSASMSNPSFCLFAIWLAHPILMGR